MKHSRTRFALLRTGALCAFACLSLAVACEARMPTSAEVDAMTVADAEKAAVSAKLLAEKQSHDRVYVVDDRAVTEAEAHALVASKIATIDVRGRKSALDKDQVFITTLDKLAPPTGDNLMKMKMAMRTRVLSDSGLKPLDEKRQLSKKSFDGIVMVDGVVSPLSALEDLKLSGRIESVNVIKGAAAARFSSEPAALNGIIMVKTKAAQQ